jgi:hypothetical protein
MTGEMNNMLAAPRSIELLNNYTLNKGTAFTGLERTRLGSHRLLPLRSKPWMNKLSAPMVRSSEKTTLSSATLPARASRHQRGSFLQTPAQSH